jgi:predicted permease
MAAATSSPLLPRLDQVRATFSASLRSVGTAVTLAAVGFYLHRRNYLSSEGKRTLALISQQVTTPLFLFSRILYCNQDWSDAPCPNVVSSLEDVWPLVLWPLVCVGAGLAVGVAVARVAGTPPEQVRTALAAVAFGNSTGLPITLLAVVHASFSAATSDLGAMDPTLFLSVYLLLYPVLMWGLGGWLLAPVEEEQGGAPKQRAAEQSPATQENPATTETTPLVPHLASDAPKGYTDPGTNDLLVPLKGGDREGGAHKLLCHNVLHNSDVTTLYLAHRRGLVSNDEGMYMSELDLQGLVQQQLADDESDAADLAADDDGQGEGHAGDMDDEIGAVDGHLPSDERSFPLDSGLMTNSQRLHKRRGSSLVILTVEAPLLDRPVSLDQMRRSVSTSPSQYDVDTIRQAVSNILSRCLQPPVVGALSGMAVAALPSIRGLLVDLEQRQSRAPLEWMFDALYSVGQAAVPLNMMILGANLSGAYRKETMTSPWVLERKTVIGIVLGKLLVLPLLGILLVWFLKTFCWNIPDDIDASFYLVLMIVFLCPTANNVMVMVELSGSSRLKEGMAQVIALQYVVAPVILSVTMTVAVGVASGWS